MCERYVTSSAALADPVSKPIHVNVLGRREFVAIDPARDAVVERIGLTGADGNHGLQTDREESESF